MHIVQMYFRIFSFTITETTSSTHHALVVMQRKFTALRQTLDDKQSEMTLKITQHSDAKLKALDLHKEHLDMALRCAGSMRNRCTALLLVSNHKECCDTVCCFNDFLWLHELVSVIDCCSRQAKAVQGLPLRRCSVECTARVLQSRHRHCVRWM